MLSQSKVKPLRHVPITWPWRNFSRAEMACRHCGEEYYFPAFMDALQDLRDEIGKPLMITSGHRCAHWNALQGGRPLSEHLKLAVDIDLQGHDRLQLARAAKRAGFTGIGYAQTFLHLDMGRRRFWYYGERSKKLWLS